MKEILFLSLVFCTVIAIPLPEVHGCIIFAKGKKATVDGSVIISHTDTGPDFRIFACRVIRKRGLTIRHRDGIRQFP